MDTLSCDTTLLSLMRNHPAYDYSHELETQEVSLMDWIWQKIMDFLNEVFGEITGNHLTTPLMIMAGLALTGLVLWFLYKKRPELFLRNAKRRLFVEEEGDTIYGIDFEKEIQQTVQRGDYRGAVRYL